MTVVIFWLVFSVGVGFIAKKKGKNPFVWTIIAGVISPVVALIVLLVTSSNSEESNSEKEKIDAEKITKKIRKFGSLKEEEIINERVIKEE